MQAAVNLIVSNYLSLVWDCLFFLKLARKKNEKEFTNYNIVVHD